MIANLDELLDAFSSLLDRATFELEYAEARLADVRSLISPENAPEEDFDEDALDEDRPAVEVALAESLEEDAQ